MTRRDVVRYSQFGVPAATVLDKAAALPESLVGSKLALVLHEIASSPLARSDATLRQLARHALAGYTTHNGGDVYTQIRDRLHSRAGVRTGGFDRAAKLATAFNWHKVSHALDVDRVVAKFLKTRGRKDVVDSGWAFRQAHDAYGKGYEHTRDRSGVSQERRQQVLDAVRNHVVRELKGYVPPNEITHEHVLKSMARLAHGEHARELLGTLPAKTTVTVPDHPVQAHFDTKTGPRMNPKRGVDQFSRRGVVERYGLFNRTPVVPDEGVVHTSHPGGRPGVDDPAKVLAERSAVLHAMNVLGIVPQRKTGESPEQYAARINVGVRAMTQEVRDHVLNNPTDPLVVKYRDLASLIEAPRDEVDPTGRISLPAAEVSTMGLSAALAPLVTRIAREAGLAPGRHPTPGGGVARTPPPRRVLAEHVPEPVPPEPGADVGGDLTSPPTIADYSPEDLDRSFTNRATWGSETPALHDPTGESEGTDFLELPEVADLGTSPLVESVRKASTAPRKKPMGASVRRAIYQTITDHLEGMGHVDEAGVHHPPESTVLDRIVGGHGITKRAASAVFGAYNRAKEAGRLPDPEQRPTQRVYPEVPRPNRLSRRGVVEKYAQGFVAPAGGMVARGTFYKGGQRIPSMGGEFMKSGRRRRKRKPRRQKAQADTSDHLPVDTGKVGTPGVVVGYKRRNVLDTTLSPSRHHGMMPVSHSRRQVMTTAIRYSREPFLDKLQANENDTTTRKVFADWLEENEPDTHPNVLHTLRNYEGRLWVGLSPKGRVNAIPRLSKQLLEESAAKSPWGTPSGEFYHSTSTNRQGRAHRVRPSGKMKTWKTRADEFRVPWKFGMYDNGEFTHRNVHEWLIADPTAEPGE